MFNPYEMFGGCHSGVHINQREIHLRNGSRPIIISIDVPKEFNSKFHKMLDTAINTLESIQKQKIKINYC